MKYFYTAIFSLSIILLNPWGNSRGAIWTEPKVLVLLVICLANFLILCGEEWQSGNETIKVPRSWKISLMLWGLFLGIGLLSSLHSPFPIRSLFGQNEMGDGWLYWLMVAGFTLSNTLLLRLHPEIIRPQLQGLLIGGIIVAVSIFPQAINWHIDYTATMGKILKENVLVSTIFQNQQPIGLYSHRGHVAFVLAFTGVLSLVAWQWGWISTRLVKATFTLTIPALLLTQTRAGILALVVGTAYLLGQKYYRLLIPMTLISLLAVGITTNTRQINNLPVIKQLTSDRIYLWELASQGISKRPLLGWGFDGFGIAYPHILNPHWTPKVVRLGNFSFDYLSQDGQIRTQPLISNKAHNLILDAVLSVGILGMLSYSALWGYCLWCVIQSPCRGIEAVVLAYIIFTFTWFECAQFAHLAWWTLSLQANRGKLPNSNFDAGL